MYNFSNITLVSVAGIKVEEAVESMKRSLVFPYYKAIIISPEKPLNLIEPILWKKCRPLNTLDEYSLFILKELCEFIDSEYALIVQADSWIIRPEKWNNDWFNYDYIGAPWCANEHFTSEGINVRVGNGGFTFRSKKMLHAFNDLGLEFTDKGTGFKHEDGNICVYYRKEMEDFGIKFAPFEVASAFSHETHCSDSNLEPFGFHKYKI